jgi:hypothetical protein
MQVRNLSRLFRLADGLAFAAVTVAVIAVARPTPDLFAPLVLGGLALLPALYLLEAYTFHRRETVGRHALRVSAAFGVVGVVVLLATLMFGRTQANLGLLAGWGAALFATTALLHLAWWRTVDHGRPPDAQHRRGRRHGQRRAPDRSGPAHRRGQCAGRVRRPPGPRARAHIMGVPVLGDTGALLDHRIMPYVDRVMIAVQSTAQGACASWSRSWACFPIP